MVKVVQQWNRLLIEVMDPPSLIRLGGPLREVASSEKSLEKEGLDDV